VNLHHAAYFDQLLPFLAVAGESRHLSCGYGDDLARADLCHHTFESGPRRCSCRRAAEILVDGDIAQAQTNPSLAAAKFIIFSNAE
jgi:hypothetical protein